MKARRIAGGALALMLLSPAAWAYLYLFRAGATEQVLSWPSFPIAYRVAPRGVTGVSVDQLREVAAQAFRSWEEVPTAQVSTRFEGFATDSPANPLATTVGFDDTLPPGVLALTRVFTLVGSTEIRLASVSLTTVVPWTLEGSVRLELRSLSFAGGRVVPFLRGGGAYLKESSAEGGDGFGGHTLHAGLGPQIRLSSPARGALKELGLRVEGRLSSRRGGIWRDERYHGGSVRGELCAAF